MTTWRRELAGARADNTGDKAADVLRSCSSIQLRFTVHGPTVGRPVDDTSKSTLTHARPTVRARPSHRAKPRSSRSELAQRWQASAASTRARPSPTGAPRARAIANPEAQPTERSHGRPLMCKPGTSGFIHRPMRACTVWLRASASTPRRSRQSESATRVCGLPIGAVDRSSPSSARDAWWREGGGSPETTGFNVDALSCGSGSAVFV